MGVVNVTPDSFSDGGVHLDPDTAAAAARRMLEDGAAIVDVGGESTRPGSDGVSLDEELRRVVPVLELLERGSPVSIDTAKADVARRAIDLGAEMVNDVTALRADPDLAGVVADSGAYLCLMHMQGEPRTMQLDPRYGDVA
jgi:dihydropteroate synthase